MTVPHIPRDVVEDLYAAGYIIVPKSCVAPALRSRVLQIEPTFDDFDCHPTEMRQIEALRGAVCEVFGIAENDLLGKSRVSRLVRPRHLGMFLAKERLHLPMRLCAAAFNRWDHSTTANAISKIRTLAPERKAELLGKARDVMRVYEARMAVYQ